MLETCLSYFCEDLCYLCWHVCFCFCFTCGIFWDDLFLQLLCLWLCLWGMVKFETCRHFCSNLCGSFSIPFFFTLFAVMAKLDAVMAETLEMTKIEKAKKASQKCRLIADPYIQVGQIQICLEGYMSYMKTSDLWSLIGPPPSLGVANWHTCVILVACVTCVTCVV